MRKREPVELKDSEIDLVGEIPQDWDALKLRRKTKQHKQGYYTTEDYVSDGVKLARITDLDKKGNVDYSDMPSVVISKKDFEAYSLQRGDFLFPRTGSIGLFGYVEKPMNAVFASYLIRFRFKDELLPEYLKYYFGSNLFLHGIKRDLHGGVNQNIHAENIKDQFVLSPSESEQKAIATFLDRKTQAIDQLIDKKRQLIEKLKEKRQALITKAVTKGLNPDAPMKDSGIEWLGEIPVHWEVKRLKFVMSTTPSKQEIPDDLYNEKVSFLPMEKVGEDGSLILDEARTVESVYNGYTYFSEEDVTVAKITPCFENGKGAIMRGLTNGIGFGTTELTVFRPKNVHPDYLHYIMRSWPIRNIGEAYMYGAGGQKRVPDSFFENFYLGLPSIEEQVGIINQLKREFNRIDDVTTSLINQIQTIKEYRQSLISAAVTGKIDVRDEVEVTANETLAS